MKSLREEISDCEILLNFLLLDYFLQFLTQLFHLTAPGDLKWRWFHPKLFANCKIFEKNMQISCGYGPDRDSILKVPKFRIQLESKCGNTLQKWPRRLPCQLQSFEGHFKVINGKTCQDNWTSVSPVLHVVASASPDHHQVDAAQVDDAANNVWGFWHWKEKMVSTMMLVTLD